MVHVVEPCGLLWLIGTLLLLPIHVLANWDEATGHLRDFRPTKTWLSKNNALLCTYAIQVAECARNTRLHFPSVQVFAHFQVNHSDDNYHGCPYGRCCAYSVLPRPGDMVADFTNHHSFFWHDLAGVSGTGTNPISDPQSGAWGYETSDGQFHHGPPNYSLRQEGHDSNYPNIDLPEKWPTGIYGEELLQQPQHPKCGTPCGENLDPGQQPGVGHYKPAPAESYVAPTEKRLNVPQRIT